MTPEEFMALYWRHFMIAMMAILGGLAILVAVYALRTRKLPEKKEHPKYFVNEVLIVVLLLVNIVIYPFLFDNIVVMPEHAHQIYTFIGVAGVINIIAWIVLVPIWRVENWFMYKFIFKKEQGSYVEWKERIRTNFKDTGFRDLLRKLIHFAYIPLIVVFWNQFSENPLGGGWNSQSSAVYYQANILYGFMIVMVIFDLVRLHSWKTFGLIPRIWAEGCIKPNELNTFNSASPMLLSIMPFVLAGHRIFYCVVLIASVSDAMASIIGKNFGRRKIGKKTVAGFIAGTASTYLIIILINFITPFPGYSVLDINILAVAGAIAFFFVDRYVDQISDNFANPIIVGLTLTILNWIISVL